MKKNRIRALIGTMLVVSLLCIGCGTVNSQTKAECQPGQEEGTISVPFDASLTKEKDALYLPKIEEVVSYPYYYLCYFTEASQVEQYKHDLLAMGLKLVSQETVLDITYDSYADSEKKVVVVETEETVVVTVTDVYEGMENEENAYSKETVYDYIQKEYNNQLGVKDSNVSYEYPPEIFMKCWIPELYEKTYIQAYQTFTREGKSTGIYLIADDLAYRIQDELNNICIADLDDNGTSELLSLYGFGSGIFRIHLNIYQYSNPIYFNGPKKVVNLCYTNCFVPKGGYAELAFKKISAANVHLVDMKYEYSEDETGSENQIIYGDDYGKIVVGQNSLYAGVEDMDRFPFYEWDKYFVDDKSSDDKNSKKQELSDDVPELTVHVGDTLIKNSSWKETWGTDTQEQISFSDLMKDNTEILRFACPHMYEYTDEICLEFPDGVKPETIKLQDCLILKDGTGVYGKTGIEERELRYGEDGKYYVGLMQHFALYLSSSMDTYTNPSYRGFRVVCQFDQEHICEYVFVLSLDPDKKME